MRNLTTHCIITKHNKTKEKWHLCIHMGWSACMWNNKSFPNLLCKLKGK